MSVPKALTTDNTVVVAIDFQERLFPVMHDKEKLLKNVLKLIKGTQALKIPVILTEQYPKGLGPTLLEIKELLPDVQPIEKTCFSCCDEGNFTSALEATKKKQVLICGIEAHICVSQTALHGVSDYAVHVVSDAVSSRSPHNQKIALDRMMQAGVTISSTEMAIYELLGRAGTDTFREILKVVK